MLKVLEFFAGIGLMRYGLEATQKMSVIWANDIDPLKKRMYLAQYPKDEHIFALTDVNTINGANVPTADIATASFPCTDLSICGQRAGLEGLQSSAFWGFANVLHGMSEDRRPKLVMIENVTGLRTSHKGRDLEDICVELNRLGYAVEFFGVDARHFVPQSRPRLFVVGVRTEGVTTEGVIDEEFYVSRPHIKRIPGFRDYCNPSGCRSLKPELTLDILFRVYNEMDGWQDEWSVDLARKEAAKMDSGAYNWLIAKSKDCSNWHYATGFRRTRTDRITARKGVRMELRTDGLAGCLRTSGGGSSRQFVFRAGYGEFAARTLTAHECAALMGAPPDYADNLRGFTQTQATGCFGDAVCVPVITWIGEHILLRLWDRYFGQSIQS